jgi:hypothetical protein
MARYIDGDKLKGLMRLDKSGIEYKLKQEMLHWDRKLECKAYLDAIEYCVQQINEAPTADVAKVRADAVREFAEFLIDKAENNVIRIGDLCDYVINFNEMTEEK